MLSYALTFLLLRDISRGWAVPFCKTAQTVISLLCNTLDSIWLPRRFAYGYLSERKKKEINFLDRFLCHASRSKINLPNNSRSILHLHAPSINTLHISATLRPDAKKIGSLTYSSKSITSECLFILDLRNSMLQLFRNSYFQQILISSIISWVIPRRCKEVINFLIVTSYR